MNRIRKIESKWMNCCQLDGKKVGHIALSHLAIPETMKVTLLGEEMTPAAFDDYGHPVFTEEQYNLYRIKADQVKRKMGENIPVKLEVAYDVDTVDVSCGSFDTIEGIQTTLTSLDAFNQMIVNRKRFCKANPEKKLSQFWLFGCFCLDENGQLLSVDKSEKYNVIPCEEVMYYSDFCDKHRNFTLTGNNGGFAIPKPGAICQCCGKLLTMEDVRHDPCIYDEGKYYHESCYRSYQGYMEVDRFTRCLMNNIYEMFRYTYDLLPNGSCNRKCFANIPWFMFHTEHGDIKMGRKNNTIFIEWQENYLPFGIDDLFASEDVIKWEKEGRRGIHASGELKAIEYLKKARSTVAV